MRNTRAGKIRTEPSKKVNKSGLKWYEFGKMPWVWQMKNQKANKYAKTGCHKNLSKIN